ncbi:chromosome partitioning protein, partial [Roseobacter denitrificans OCh 114]
MTDSPPYFNISPDKAHAELPPPMDTAALLGIAQACNQGRNDL